MIDLITYCDKHQKILKDLYFKPSFNLYLKSSFNHIDIIYENNNDIIKEKGFGSPIFQHMIYDRWNILINHIKNNKNPNQISVFSDIDIIFFGDFSSNIQELFFKPQSNNRYYYNQNIDIYFMPETIATQHHKNPKLNFNINAGFFIFRHSEETLKFFEYILNFMTSQKIKEDQLYIRKELKQNYHPNIGLLDFNIFNTNNCSIDLNLNLKSRSLKVFHATSCFDIYHKMIVLNRMIESNQKNLLENMYGIV